MEIINRLYYMQTSKSVQMLDEQTNNISPITCLESVYVEVKNGNTIQRKNMSDKFISRCTSTETLSSLSLTNQYVITDVSFMSTFDLGGGEYSNTSLTGLKITRIKAEHIGDDIKKESNLKANKGIKKTVNTGVNFTESNPKVTLSLDASTGNVFKFNSNTIYVDEKAIADEVNGKGCISTSTEKAGNNYKANVELVYDKKYFDVINSSLTFNTSYIKTVVTSSNISCGDGVKFDDTNNVMRITLDVSNSSNLRIENNKLVFTPSCDWINPTYYIRSIINGPGIYSEPAQEQYTQYIKLNTSNIPNSAIARTPLYFDSQNCLVYNQAGFNYTVANAVRVGDTITAQQNTDGSRTLDVKIHPGETRLKKNQYGLYISGALDDETTQEANVYTGGTAININNRVVSLKVDTTGILKVTSDTLCADTSNLVNSNVINLGNVDSTNTFNILLASKDETTGNNISKIRVAGGTDKIRLASGKFEVGYNANFKKEVECSSLKASGNAVVSGTLMANEVYVTSDIRRKTDITPLSKSCVDDMPTIKKFNWVDTSVLSYGYIAQELEAVHPELVNTDDDGMKSVNYTAALCYTVAQLTARVEQLERQIDLLKASI